MKLCCIVKPDAVSHIDAIALALAEGGVTVMKRKEIIYSASLIESLYDHMSPDAVVEIVRRMGERKGIALLVTTHSIEHLLTVAGSESNPALCAPTSVRARFGKDAPEERMGSWPWWENVIHRPIDEREAKRDLSLLFP